MSVRSMPAWVAPAVYRSIVVLHESTGVLRYGDNWRLVLEIEQELADYYRSLIPRYYGVVRPGYRAHVTVVRPEKEIPPDHSCWGQYEGLVVPFQYSSEIRTCETKRFFWLDVYCRQLELIRLELGLSVRRMFNDPTLGCWKCFHCTIARAL